ncbi:TadE-like protein [Novosphingobium aromaticivorans DSM 12444]|uniref:TadE-like protein n=1 Tax=Novosphingobium aromaticivorans (strain ATCC 700278 / DSM 12444 / CCUG 56034 / CIP 105152 / NBRC 16084 / F199) TaxID=279238 RepID=Q2G5D9_NOVAD|nr:TadE/TadG family type IV pilus assembly protein [Novosphingobium aromaticivorans]ABD26934.1 TadE-like protein [Novosphingobium aromaticivorans DSM 12444]SCY45895.1 Flp pilus assembly protein TadG [Novosphingobium aromaticivorans]
MKRPGKLVAEDCGVTTIEFALVLPVFLLAIVGCLDLGQMVYAVGVLDGAVEKAARSAALETGDTTAADAEVEDVMSRILPGSTLATSRKSYANYSDINRPERWNDADNNGTCSEGETYVDENGSGAWESDVGSNGNGSASDVVVYTVTVTYEPIFAMPLLPINWNTRELTSSAIKRNQPYAAQPGYGSDSGTC